MLCTRVYKRGQVYFNYKAKGKEKGKTTVIIKYFRGDTLRLWTCPVFKGLPTNFGIHPWTLLAAYTVAFQCSCSTSVVPSHVLLGILLWRTLVSSPSFAFPGGSVVKEFICNAGEAGDLGLIPGSGRFPGGGNGNPLQYPCWEIPWTEECGMLQSMGSWRVGCDWAPPFTFYSIIYLYP